MGSSCTGGKFLKSKRKNITQNKDELQESSAPNNEENIDPNQSLVDNQQESSEPKIFTFAQMVAATNNFNAANILGAGGFGIVYKGRLQENDQIVAIKKMEREESQGKEEFRVEIGTLTLADHPNLVRLIGYCSEERERLLVYEYMPLGSLSDHLHGVRPDSVWLDWNTRMKIAAGAAGGLAYLHHEMDPPIIYRDVKASNILLDEGFHVKLSDFGLAKVGPTGDDSHVFTRVMGTYGYFAPEYAMTGRLSFKSDVYSFGVVLLELVTGRKVIDDTKPASVGNLVLWARPMLRDPRNFPQMVDPMLDGKYPSRGLHRVLAIASLCLQSLPSLRPSAADVFASLSYLATQHYDPETQRLQGNVEQAGG